MHFKQPEFLYFLFLLLIPVLVHLFQLRKYKSEAFTNVRFLQKAVSHTRKSARIKKWLILFTRLGLLACIILAFAQPYFPSQTGLLEPPSHIIYLDNSYSMQAKGKNGILLKRSIQELLEHLPDNEEVSVFTNDMEFPNITLESLRKRLLKLDYATEQLPWSTVVLKAQELASSGPKDQTNFIAISDFQIQEGNDVFMVPDDLNTFLVALRPEDTRNIALDSVYVSSQSLNEITLEVEISAFDPQLEEISVGLYNDKDLLARKTVEIAGKPGTKTSFTLPANPVPLGRVSIEDHVLPFDNTLYFSIDKSPAVEVVIIGDASSSFLSRIFKAPEFNVKTMPSRNLDFQILSKANLVFLNELENVSLSLSTKLQELDREHVFITIIPPGNAKLQEYNGLFRSLKLPVFGEFIEQERLITDISFDHPLFQTVFDKEVENFQYPFVKSYFQLNKKERPVLAFESGDAFLYQVKNKFVFTAPINPENSNFQSAPLIVPSFYNMGNLAVTPSKLYSIIGTSREFVIQTQLQKDEILRLQSGDYNFIPRQQSYSNKVALYFEDAPKKEGHYRVLKDTLPLRSLSFNLSREESRLSYMDFSSLTNANVSKEIPDVFQNIRSANEVNQLWKWFIIFALFFLIAEIFILKFL